MTRFGEDVWVSDKSLASRFPGLVNLSLSKNIIFIREFMEGW